ncbi:hypothetical protein MSAN_02499600 [Mycena sanguinolenta]|uniref:DUF6533 domain-containing protein n=1 Tax=Mycena sanguinolenta TaxID=230812 RepID=A0A8H6WRC2_9AGAR|nr:hypothetical protein MSAN_02499600 [Mycena sanguinolenta]
MQCATAAFVTVLVYDWLLTMRLEVEFIWRQKMSFGKLLYFINRYLVIIDLVILLNSYANPIIHGSKVPAAPNSLLDNDALCPSFVSRGSTSIRGLGSYRLWQSTPSC